MLRDLDGLLERRPVLEDRRRDRDRAGDRRAIAIEALRVGVVRAVPAAVERRRVDRRKGLAQRRLQRDAALGSLAAPAVHTRPTGVGGVPILLASEEVAQV